MGVAAIRRAAAMGSTPDVERAAAWELETLAPQAKQNHRTLPRASLLAASATALLTALLALLMVYTLKLRVGSRALLTWETFELRECKEFEPMGAQRMLWPLTLHTRPCCSCADPLLMTIAFGVLSPLASSKCNAHRS